LYCREVKEPADLQSIHRLRYEVYVEEMGRRQRYADHDRRLLQEPLDDDAIHLAAYPRDGGAPLGALRLHLSSRSRLEVFEQLYGLAPGRFASRTMVITRLITQPRARGGRASAGLLLAKAAYRLALEEGVEHGYIDCGRPLVPFFEWLGFDCLRLFEHAEYGEIAIMQMDPRDADRLAKTDSPFLPLLEAERVEASAACAPGPLSEPVESPL
jgi:N-acyl-L-homoserine lactone synthetase